MIKKSDIKKGTKNIIFTDKKDITSLVYFKTAHGIKCHNQTIVHKNGPINTPRKDG